MKKYKITLDNEISLVYNNNPEGLTRQEIINKINHLSNSVISSSTGIVHNRKLRLEILRSYL